MTVVWAIGAFLLGVVIVVWSTEQLMHGMIGLAALLRAPPFVIAAVFSGLEAENIAVGVVAGRRHHAEIALGTVLGGSIFMICVALGLGAVLFPLKVTLPRGVLLLLAASPLLAALALMGGTTGRPAGAVLLVSFGASIWYLVRVSGHHDFLTGEAAQIHRQTATPGRWWPPVALTAVGLAIITVGAELVNYGAQVIIGQVMFPAALMGMVITPAAIEAEEVIRQAVPAKEGHHDVAVGNLVGTLLYFVLFNLGLIAVIAPVSVPTHVIVLDWPFLIGVTWLAVTFLWRGRLTRLHGVVLLALYASYLTAHVLLTT